MSVPTTRFAGAITFGLLAICLTAVCKPTACRADEVDQIDISYVEPESDELRPAYLELKKRGVLEQLQTFLSPLKLPRRLLVQAKQCGSNGGAYAPGGAVIICYEDVSRIEQTLPEEAEILVGPGALTGENRGRLKREDLIVAPSSWWRCRKRRSRCSTSSMCPSGEMPTRPRTGLPATS
jgi:hypothetical protein